MVGVQRFLGATAELIIAAAVVISIYTALNNRVDSFAIFDPGHLHSLAQKAIGLHGNNTRAIVTNIVGDLSANATLAPYLNLKEEWIFNNAGGAMGVMYIIHASKFPLALRLHLCSRHGAGMISPI
jgi:C-8 sterol isomerase